MAIIKEVRLNEGPQGAPVTVLSSGFTKANEGLTYDAASAATGVFGAITDASTTEAAATIEPSPALAGVSIAESFKVPVVTSGTLDLVVLRVGVGFSASVNVMLADSGNIRVRSTGGTVVWESDGLVTPGDFFHLRLRVKKGTTTNDGEIHLAVYKNAETTPWEPEFSTTAANTGTASYDKISFGKLSSQAYALSIDDCAVDDDSSEFIPLFQNTLATPVLQTVTHNPSAQGLTDGKIDVSWGAVSGAVQYERGILPGTVTSGFTSQDSGVGTTHTFTNLSAGTYTVFVRAMPS